MTRTIALRAAEAHPPTAAGSGSLRLVAAAAERVHRWASATDAQRRTRHELAPLARRGWGVAHAVELPGTHRIDHVVAGPGGIFVLASRAWSGVVTVDSKGATITPPDAPDEAWTARGPHRSLLPAASAAVHALIVRAGGPVPAPRAVVVVWAPFPERVSDGAGVTYVAGPHLVRWLTEQPARPERLLLDALLPVTVPAAPRPRRPRVADRSLG